VAINAQHPVHFIGDLVLEHCQGFCEFGNLSAACWIDFGSAGVKQDLGLKDEPVADDANILPVTQDFEKASTKC